MKTWIAKYTECYRGCCDEASVAIHADTFEEATEIAKRWEQSLAIRLTVVTEFTEESELIDSHYG